MKEKISKLTYNIEETPYIRPTKDIINNNLKPIDIGRFIAILYFNRMNNQSIKNDKQGFNCWFNNGQFQEQLDKNTLKLYVDKVYSIQKLKENFKLDNNNLVHIALDTQLSQLAKTDLSNGTYKSFLILTRLKDETNTYLVFKKRPGQTSYGFIIPGNLSPSVLNNIDTITRQVQQKLIQTQQGTTINTV